MQAQSCAGKRNLVQCSTGVSEFVVFCYAVDCQMADQVTSANLDRVLSTWKAIASYLGVSVRTAQVWAARLVSPTRGQ